MPVYTVEWRTAADRGVYPHMAKHDAALWERFLDTYGPHFNRFSYDVALGGMLVAGDVEDAPLRKGFQYSTALKIDAVGERPDDVWIIEVRPNAGVSALGGALCYEVMATRDPFTSKPLVPVVLTDRASPDIRLCCEALGVTLIELDAAP